MSFGSPDVPSVPNPQVTAQQQQDINKDTLQTLQSANQVNQVTPTGSLTYTQTGTGPNGTPTYTATQTLAPGQQALLDLLQGNQKTAGTQAGALLSNANYGASGTDPSKIVGDATSGNTQALLKQETDYLSPQFKTQTDQLDAKLRAQGIFPGQPAYDQQMRDLQLNQNQAVTGFLATAEPQAYQQAVSSYMMPLSMAATELGLSQPSGIGLTTTPQQSMNPANLEGDVASANSANMAAYNAQMNQQNAMMSGLFGLGAAGISGGTGGFGNSMLGALFKSDRRIKKNIRQVGTMFDGTPIYRFQYIGSEQWQIGVMAQDIEQFEPNAVHEINGVKYVNYRLATERAASHGS